MFGLYMDQHMLYNEMPTDVGVLFAILWEGDLCSILQHSQQLSVAGFTSALWLSYWLIPWHFAGIDDFWSQSMLREKALVNKQQLYFW